MLSATVSGPNASGYSGGYDVSTVALLDRDRRHLRIVAVNRGPAYSAAVNLGSWSMEGGQALRTSYTASSGTTTKTVQVKSGGRSAVVLRLPAQSISVHVIPIG